MREIPYRDFLRDIRNQRNQGKAKKPKEPRELHPEALSREEYDRLTRHGRRRLKRPRPVWLGDKKRWTVGAPVNPIEWQILLWSEPTRARKRITINNIQQLIVPICGHPWIREDTLSECVGRLQDKHLLKTRGGFRRARIVVKWLRPDLTGQRAGGKWHQKSIRNFVEGVNRMRGCYTYVDRGHSPGARMPDVIIVKPKLVERTRYGEPREEPLEWDMKNPIYAEFKSAVDMRNNPGRLEKQLEHYDGIPLYLKVEARVSRAKNMLEDYDRREVDLIDLLKNPESDKICLFGSERPRAERSFMPVIDRIKRAFTETYDQKARLRKTGTDPQGRECHDLILYDKLGTPKNVGQVIPRYAEDVKDFVDRFFEIGYLGCVITGDYVYEPERKPTRDNKTWKWVKRKTTGGRFRSFSG